MMAATDYGEPITLEWLQRCRFSWHSTYLSLVLPAHGESAPIELRINEQSEEFGDVFGSDGWIVSLVQGLPHGDDQRQRDDHVVITSKSYQTRGELRSLFAGLGVPFPEPITKRGRKP